VTVYYKLKKFGSYSENKSVYKYQRRKSYHF